MVERAGSDLALSAHAHVLSLSRSSVSYQPRPVSPREVAIKHRIDAVYTAYPFSGSRRIHAVLQAEFGALARNTVRQSMHDMGISAIYPGPHLSRRQHDQQMYPYLGYGNDSFIFCCGQQLVAPLMLLRKARYDEPMHWEKDQEC